MVGHNDEEEVLQSEGNLKPVLITLSFNPHLRESEPVVVQALDSCKNFFVHLLATGYACLNENDHLSLTFICLTGDNFDYFLLTNRVTSLPWGLKFITNSNTTETQCQRERKSRQFLQTSCWCGEIKKFNCLSRKNWRWTIQVCLNRSFSSTQTSWLD